MSRDLGGHNFQPFIKDFKTNILFKGFFIRNLNCSSNFKTKVIK